MPIGDGSAVRFRVGGKRFRGYFHPFIITGSSVDSSGLADSMTSGEPGDARFSARGSNVSIFFSDTVRPAASKTVTMTVVMLHFLRRHRHNSCVIEAQRARRRPSHAVQCHLFSDYHILL